MSDLTVARRYARALYEEAERAQKTEQVDRDIEVIRESLEGSRELVRFFESPVISREKKETIVAELFASRVEPLTLRFLKMLVEKKRENIFPAVVTAYRELRDSRLGIVEARARTAEPLGEADKKRLEKALEEVIGKRIRLQTEIDPALIGGVVIRVGDSVYDGSVRHQLATLRDQFAQRSFVMN